jgi:hypothetical protein
MPLTICSWLVLQHLKIDDNVMIMKDLKEIRKKVLENNNSKIIGEISSLKSKNSIKT